MRTFLNNLFVRLGAATEGGPGDDQLLAAYVASRDESAFQQIVRRHGPMVLGVCRRVLRNEADADDAFQAVFLVFLRKAEAVRPGNLLGNWLYGVAVNVARKGRELSMRRKTHELLVQQPRSPETPPDADLKEVIDQELSRLPADFRAAVVACDLEGRTRKEAAGQLGWSEGTVASRLARARSILADRLSRRGIALPAAGVAVALGSPAIAAVPQVLITGHAAAIETLASEVIRAMAVSKLKGAVALVLAFVALGGVGVGVVYASGGGLAEAPPPRPAGDVALIRVEEPKTPEKKPTHFPLTNPSKDIVIVSDRDEKFVDFFRRQKVMVAGATPKEYEAAVKADKVSEKLFVNYASHNQANPMNATYGAYVKLAPVTKPVAEALAAMTKEKNDAYSWSLILIPDAKEKDVWHVVGLTTRTSVGFFASKDKKGTDDFAPTDLVLPEKK